MSSRSAWLGLYVLLAGACSVQAGGGAIVSDGALLLDWTINGTKDPNQCAQGSVATIRVDVYDAGGGFVGEFDQDCTAFATSISLAPGHYSGHARLIDASVKPRTTSIDIVPWRIESGGTLTVPIDFPASSFGQGQSPPTSL